VSGISHPTWATQFPASPHFSCTHGPGFQGQQSDRVKCSRSVLSLVLVALVFKDSIVIESSVPGPCCDLFVQLIQSTLHALIVQ